MHANSDPGFCKDFQTLQFSPLPGATNRTMKLCNSASEVSANTHTRHDVFSVVVLHKSAHASAQSSNQASIQKGETRYIVDITGPQYGWFTPAMKYDTYQRNHVLTFLSGYGTGQYVKHTPYMHGSRIMWDEAWRYQMILWVDERLVARLDRADDLLPEHVFLGQAEDGQRAREEFLRVFKELVYEALREFGDVGQAWHKALRERRYSF